MLGKESPLIFLPGELTMPSRFAGAPSTIAATGTGPEASDHPPDEARREVDVHRLGGVGQLHVAIHLFNVLLEELPNLSIVALEGNVLP